MTVNVLNSAFRAALGKQALPPEGEVKVDYNHQQQLRAQWAKDRKDQREREQRGGVRDFDPRSNKKTKKDK